MSADQELISTDSVKDSDFSSDDEMHDTTYETPMESSNIIVKNKNSLFRKPIKKVCLLSPCTLKCRQKCSLKLTEENRQTILNNFQAYNFGQRRLFCDKYIVNKIITTQTICNNQFKRSYSSKYYLPINNEQIQVCKTMFLHTLGKKSDKFITCFKRSKHKKGFVETIDKRGRALADSRIISALNLETKVQAFIASFQPGASSQYNIDRAPLRRYFPPKISITFLHKEYNKAFEKISYETFRTIFAKQKIRFKTPSQNKNTTCSMQEQHFTKISEDDNNQTCMASFGQDNESEMEFSTCSTDPLTSTFARPFSTPLDSSLDISFNVPKTNLQPPKLVYLAKNVPRADEPNRAEEEQSSNISKVTVIANDEPPPLPPLPPPPPAPKPATVNEVDKSADGCTIFGDHVACKMRQYSLRTRNIAQHHINNILFDADMGKYEQNSGGV